MNTQKISVKLYLDRGRDVAPEVWFKTFNTWISDHEGADVLIDVADYSHVHAGPVTLLVGHQYDISLDDTDEKRGLLYYRKRQAEGDFSARLGAAVRAACEICRRIETDPELGERVAFRAGEMRIVLNDRLHAPNDEATHEKIRADLGALLNRIYAGADVAVDRRKDPKACFTLDVRAKGDWTVADLLENF